MSCLVPSSVAPRMPLPSAASNIDIVVRGLPAEQHSKHLKVPARPGRGPTACLKTGAPRPLATSAARELADQLEGEQWVDSVQACRLGIQGITRDYTRFLPILQGTTLQLQGMTLPPF